ncbi:jg825, partial [Pararge aegeria aegeria]
AETDIRNYILTPCRARANGEAKAAHGKKENISIATGGAAAKYLQSRAHPSTCPHAASFRSGTHRERVL